MPFDGSEDDEITGDARDAWQRLGMRAKIDAAVKEVKRKWNAGEIKLDYDTVRSFVRKYLKRNELDVLKEGMEEETTSDPEKEPWSDDDEPMSEDEHEDSEPSEDDPFDRPDPFYMDRSQGAPNRADGEKGGEGDHRDRPRAQQQWQLPEREHPGPPGREGVLPPARQAPHQPHGGEPGALVGETGEGSDGPGRRAPAG